MVAAVKRYFRQITIRVWATAFTNRSVIGLCSLYCFSQYLCIDTFTELECLRDLVIPNITLRNTNLYKSCVKGGSRELLDENDKTTIF